MILFDFISLVGQEMQEFLDARFFLTRDYSNSQVVYALLCILVAFLVHMIARYVYSWRLENLEKAAVTAQKKAESASVEEPDKAEDLVVLAGKQQETYERRLSLFNAGNGPITVLLYLIAVYIAVAILQPPGIKTALDKVIFTFITVDVTWFLFRFLDHLTTHLIVRYRDENQRIVTSMFPIISKTIKFFLFVIAFIVIVQNLGYSVSSLLAGLGIGGLAVALAAKDTLANIFGSVMIFLDRPFVIGDWIAVKDTEGIVEDVGFRTTRIRTWNKTEVSIPNSIISNEVIQNFTRRPQQREKFTLGLSHDTPPEKLEQAVEKIRSILAEHPDVDKDGITVGFSEFNAQYLGILVSFYVNSADFSVFMKARQEIFLLIIRALKELEIHFGIPTQMLQVAHSGEADLIVNSEPREKRGPAIPSSKGKK